MYRLAAGLLLIAVMTLTADHRAWAVSGQAGDVTASAAQYGVPGVPEVPLVPEPGPEEPGTPPAPEVPGGGNGNGPDEGEGDGQEVEGDNESGGGPTPGGPGGGPDGGAPEGDAPGDVTTVELGTSGAELPFTGVLLVPLLVLGLAALGAGLLLRRSTQR